MKILVTGSSGTIGTRLCERLIADGHEVVGADWEPNKWKPEINDITINCDLRDEAAIEKLPKDVELIVHLAANARVYELVEDPTRARDNMLTVFNVLEHARRNNIKKFIFASSRETYGNAGHDVYSEDMVDLDQCESAYSASKVSGEAMVHAYRYCYGLEPIIFRFSNVYGMYDDSDRVIPLFIRLARKNETLTVFGEDKCLDFTYIDDTVSGICQSIENYEQAKNEVYNLATGTGTTLLDFTKKLLELMGSTSDITIKPSRTGEVMRYTADISKAKEKIGYEPQYTFEQGLQKTVEWYEENM